MTNLSIALAALLAVPAFAGCATEPDYVITGTVDQSSSVHLKGGPRAKPAFTDNKLTLTSTGSLSGLGNGDVVISLSAMANPTSTCTNPAGAMQPPGQNPVPFEVTGSVAIPANEIKNGTLVFSVSTAAPVTPIAGAPDCPSSKWTQDITDMAFTDATITVEQPLGTIVLAVECAFSPETANGAVPAKNVTCSVL